MTQVELQQLDGQTRRLMVGFVEDKFAKQDAAIKILDEVWAVFRVYGWEKKAERQKDGTLTMGIVWWFKASEI